MRDTVLAVMLDLRDSLGRLPAEQELFDAVWPQYSTRVDFTRQGRGPDEVMAKCRYTLGRVQQGLVRGIRVEPSTPRPTPTPATAPAVDVFPTLGIEDLNALAPVEWLLAGILTTDGFGITYGPPASLKSFLLSLGRCTSPVAAVAGRPVGKVPFSTLRGKACGASAGASGRGWRQRQGRHRPAVPPASASVNLIDPANWQSWFAPPSPPPRRGLPDRLHRYRHRGPCHSGADENSAQDMGRLVLAIDLIKAAVDCAVHGVHHSGKDADRGARGSSALLGAVDTMIQVKRDGDHLTVQVEKQKDDDEGSPVRLRTEIIDLSEGLKSEKSLVLVEDISAGSRDRSGRRAGPRADCLFARAQRPCQRPVGSPRCLGVSTGRPSEHMAAQIPLYPEYKLWTFLI